MTILKAFWFFSLSVTEVWQDDYIIVDMFKIKKRGAEAPRERSFWKKRMAPPSGGKFILVTRSPTESFGAFLNTTLFLGCSIREALWMLMERLRNGFIAVMIGVIWAPSHLIGDDPSHAYSPPFCMESNEKYSLYIKKLTIVLCVVVLKMAILLAFSKI